MFGLYLILLLEYPTFSTHLGLLYLLPTYVVLSIVSGRSCLRQASLLIVRKHLFAGVPAIK